MSIQPSINEDLSLLILITANRVLVKKLDRFLELAQRGRQGLYRNF